MAAENSGQVSARRAAELSALLSAHLDNVREAHEMYPTPIPVTSRRLPGRGFGDWGEADQKRWNEKQKVLASANIAYNRAVRAACQRHRDEDIELSRRALEPPADPQPQAAPAKKGGDK